MKATIPIHPLGEAQSGKTLALILHENIIWRVTPLYVEQTKGWLQAHFMTIFDNPCLSMKNGEESRVSAVDSLVLKRQIPPTAASAIKFAFHFSKARSSFFLGLRLRSLGIRTPESIAWATVRKNGLRRVDYLLSKEICNCATLLDWLDNICRGAEQRENITAMLGRQLALFHVNGFSNRDMKATNILIPHGDNPKLWVVDLDGVRKKTRITRRRAIRDLYPIRLSLQRYGKRLDSDDSVLLQAYNDAVPDHMNLDCEMLK